MFKNLDKIAFFLGATALVVGGSFAFGLYSAVKKNVVFRGINALKEDVVTLFEERDNLIPGGAPIGFLQPRRKPGSGVTVDERAGDGKLVMLSSFFDGNNEIRLIRRDGEIVARWPLKYTELFPDAGDFLVAPPATDHNIDTHGALILPDGSAVFNFDYGGLVKLDRCGKVDWTLRRPAHHSLEVAEGGGFWAPGRFFIMPENFDKFPPMTHKSRAGYYLEDTLMKVSADGEVLAEKSVPEILYENGYEAILTAVGYSYQDDGFNDTELMHVNKVDELTSDIANAFPGFEAGDLVVSERTYNLLFIVDPDTWKIKWLKQGPWKRQHDPEFTADGTITLFNNNIYQLNRGPNDETNLDAPRVSNIMKVNPATNETRVVWGGTPEQELFSVVRGKVDPTPEGGYFVTEFEGARVFETDAAGKIVWEYINGYPFDENRLLEITEGKLYPADYFTVTDWSCPS